jgi:hypothetical protein
MTEATKRPWRLSERRANQNVQDPIFWHKDVIKGGIRIARCAGVGQEEAQANAELIVKAVNEYDKNQETIRELIEALKLAKSRLFDVYKIFHDTRFTDRYGDAKATHEVFIEVEKAISKAQEAI